MHHSVSAVLSSSLARWISPRVQAKMEATGLVLVGRPFWCSRQWRVTVPVRDSRRQCVCKQVCHDVVISDNRGWQPVQKMDVWKAVIVELCSFSHVCVMMHSML